MEEITPKIRVQDIDHSGIVAGIIDQMGLVELLDQEMGTHCQEIISAGVAVKAMILNGLALVSAPLYLFERFFVGKATSHLLGEGIEPCHLNDDKLGRVLDQLYEVGLTSLFVKVALQASEVFGVKRDCLHLDSSSFHVHGAYLRKETIDPEGKVLEEPIIITHGYSRDHRPDLKQFIVNLMCSGDGDVPLYLKVADGNESDQAVFATLMKNFREKWDCDAIFVADATLYSVDNMQSLANLRWVSRVPATIKDAEQLMEKVSEEAFVSSTLEGYKIACICNTYGGIRQRWLVIESQARLKSDLKQLDKQVHRQLEESQKKRQELEKKDFACAADAFKEAERLNKQLRYHQLHQIEVKPIPYYNKAGRPTKRQEPDGHHYRVVAVLIPKEEVIAQATRRAGRFVLATNILESEILSWDEILIKYKEQQSTERGFRFLKDPMFFASSVFLNTPERVASLAMVMGLCLLVYTLAQRHLRQALANNKQTVENQLRKPTSTPTMRWVFQCFQSIHLVIFNGLQQIVNLTSEHLNILQFLGSPCQKYYLLV